MLTPKYGNVHFKCHNLLFYTLFNVHRLMEIDELIFFIRYNFFQTRNILLMIK